MVYSFTGKNKNINGEIVMNDLSVVMEYLPFLIPLVIVQLGLAVYAVVHILKYPNYKFGNRTMWLIIVLLINFIGPIIYLLFGKGDD